MSLHRRAAKRDAAEPAIVSALEALGCVVWRVSGKGLPDLIVLRAGEKWLADVKGAKEKPTPAQEKAWEEAATKAQCAVFILRTPEDAAAMLNNALQPWEPESPKWHPTASGLAGHCTCGSRGRPVKRNHGTGCPNHPNPPRKGNAAKALDREHYETLSRIQRLAESAKAMVTRPAYTPPRSTPVGRRCPKGCGNHGWDNTPSGWVCSDCAMPPAEPVLVDAAKEAEATFAPRACNLATDPCGACGMCADWLARGF